MHKRQQHFDPEALREQIRGWSQELGFTRIGFAGIDLEQAGARLNDWLAHGYHGEMAYMAQHGSKRFRPAELLPGTISVISVGMDYLPEQAASASHVLNTPDKAYISRYALGRDYHKVMRKRLQQLAVRIAAQIGPFGYRAFVDSAPVMEKPLAQQAGLGWQGKHGLLLSRQGSWFFLGEILTDLPLPPSRAAASHCGRCTACIEICPTQAIVAPYVVDARRCISYLVIEYRGSIPLALRPAIGNRIYGCDDCQLACPWNRFARHGQELDFQPRHGLDEAQLTELFGWDEATFLQRTEGSVIRRIGHPGWLRNIAVALGNAPPTRAIQIALEARLDHPSELVREHVRWALAQQQEKQTG